MLEDPSDPRRQPDKLVLPAVPSEAYPAPLPDYLVHADQPFRAGRLIHKNQSSIPPGAPLHKRLTHLWHRDPAYKVLFVAIGVVLASSIVCVALLAGFIARLSPPSPPITSSSPRPQPTPTLVPSVTPQATATATLIPTPTPVPTPIVVVTPVPAATAPVVTAPPPPADGRLTVQIATLPEQINNGATIPVIVTTNQPGASVSLFITYNAIPFLYTSAPQTTDASGSTTFSWNVHERTFSPFTRMVAANVTAVARYQDRPQATSQRMTVHILTK